ncbi:MAG: bifunctional phosphoribosylaminoimidazolecarboxamide formyltransferase/IMP cyclohydrolase [Oscillospiraceae bacterium]|nr:bifunctional phosphoribosylaminoimidazolecarboxamide formyltransferase/IMP cyclohydrolase [Oscillospiraceae bacterium]
MKKRALISVSDKTGIVQFADNLLSLGFEIISTGGTQSVLEENGIEVTNISEITEFPECLDGRVKTLHPGIHAGLLAVRDNPDHMEQIAKLNILPIDIAAINLYPFKETILKPGTTFEDAIENIDIGGPAMLRSASKNWQDVIAVVDCADYDEIIAQYRQNGDVSRETKLLLAAKVFEHTAAYDTLISTYLQKRIDNPFPEKLSVTYEKVQDMRYGENPHQSAAFYQEVKTASNSLSSAVQLQGKDLSYNNINDANGALDVIKEFGYDVPAVVAVKHANPCGVGIGADIYDAYLNAYNADPVSIFGGIVAFNRAPDAKTANEIVTVQKLILDVIIAPSFDEEARKIFAQKKNLRLLHLPDLAVGNGSDMISCKRVAGGLLIQQQDVELYRENEIKCVTDRTPTTEERRLLDFAWKVAKHTKSNGIVLAKENRTVGIGPGQTNRITSLELALKYAGGNAQNAVMASDGFFPFPDCVETAHKAGITAIIQPGGSIQDQRSIDACNEAGIAMLFTGMRHFKH